jgi:hypothetical protein
VLRRRNQGLGPISIFYSCPDKEHEFERVEGSTSPSLYKCAKCSVWGFMRTRGVHLRNGRITLYRCSYSKCKRHAKIRSKFRGTGGMYEWACTLPHAGSSKFEKPSAILEPESSPEAAPPELVPDSVQPGQ